jgi:glycosyltransferase involved in cell wall biosynthesis
MPELSIIMPVYNAQLFLREAIDSILQQTFRDFEFIILNDGSTDKSEEVIRSYTDARIRYVKNERNLGLIKTLNNAIVLCTGRYIARMDSDDIADVSRFEKQLKYLQNDPNASMVCSPIIGITSSGKLRDHWPADYNNRTAEKIRKTLPKENCISHPTILVKAEILKKYKYSEAQKGSEDWDLWLRMARDGLKIIKTEEVLLKYRIHGHSITQQHNSSQHPQLKSAMVKWRFICSSFWNARMNSFVVKTFMFIFKDLAYYIRMKAGRRWLRQIKWLFTISPFQAFSQYRYIKEKMQEPSRFFLFFPYSHIGGAEKVHSQITALIEDQNPLVFFTGLNDKGGNISTFGSNAILIHAAAALYHPLFSARTKNILLKKIAQSNKAVLFGANTRFFDELVLKVKPDVFVADLTHDVNLYDPAHVSQERLAASLRCDKRIFISNKAVERTKEFYHRNFVDDQFYNRLHIIYNFVDIPSVFKPKRFEPPFRILYVGRDTPEKAVGRVFELAAKCLEGNVNVQFTLVGDIRHRESLVNLNCTGVILEKEKLAGLYEEHEFVIITSVSEGFPLSISEGMAHGCIPLATAVGDIPFHINAHRGFTVPSDDDTADEMFETLVGIFQNNHDLTAMSLSCRSYAQLNFNRQRFLTEYRQLFSLDLPR